MGVILGGNHGRGLQVRQEIRFVTDDGGMFMTAPEALRHEMLVASSEFTRQHLDDGDGRMAVFLVDHRSDLEQLFSRFDGFAAAAGADGHARKRRYNGRRPVSEDARQHMREAALRRNGQADGNTPDPDGATLQAVAEAEAESESVEEPLETPMRIAALTSDPDYARDIMLSARN